MSGIALIVGSGLLLAFYYLANVSATSGSGYGSGYQYYRGFREDSGSGNYISLAVVLVVVVVVVVLHCKYSQVAPTVEKIL